MGLGKGAYKCAVSPRLCCIDDPVAKLWQCYRLHMLTTGRELEYNVPQCPSLSIVWGYRP